MPAEKQPHVVAAMSGGVDSSVVAALLVQQGYRVTGVTLRIVPDDCAASVFEPCCSAEAAEGARAVADGLGIAHLVLDYTVDFERDVIDDFVEEYRAGRTPNPCVRCNRFIKFGALYEKARELGAQKVATGHYARLAERDGVTTLCRALDLTKDQSYVLACLTQDQLSHAMFPLGEHDKTETRAIARDLGLATAERSESQEICFIPDDNYRRFLDERLGVPKPGPILSSGGEVLGEHRGLTHYTVGQRKGLGLAAPRPYYVLRLDPDRNALVVGHEEETLSRWLTARNVNWCSGTPKTDPFACAVKIRYRHAPAPATVVPHDESVEVRFDEPQRSVTPGQWAVLYEDGEIVDGGQYVIQGNKVIVQYAGGEKDTLLFQRQGNQLILRDSGGERMVFQLAN